MNSLKEEKSFNICHHIWDQKYRYGEESLDQTLQRVAKFLSQNENNSAEWYQLMLDAMSSFELIPGGRILYGAGTSREATLMNTFVMGKISDSFESVFENLYETALTMRSGGGIGINISHLRPNGDFIAGLEETTAGPLPFLDLWSSMCGSVMSGGARRGAMMGLLACDHPDIFDFISLKKRDKFTNFNFSVLITDAFIKAVKTNDTWILQFKGEPYKVIQARELWDRVMESTYYNSEPGVIFIDRINERNNLSYCEEIVSTNSCGEQPMPFYGACPLASINLVKLIQNPFTENAFFDETRFRELISIGVRLLDNVVDLSHLPLQKQREAVLKTRRIGLGITGLADALAMMNIRYGSQQALDLLADWMQLLRDYSYISSSQVALEKGPFPQFDKDKFLRGGFARTLPQYIQKLIRQHGIRNGVLNCIAPTGSISLFANNVSSGIEPIYSLKTERKILTKQGEEENFILEDYAYKLFKQAPRATSTFVTATELGVEEHLQTQAVAQQYIDGSISKTINCPENLSMNSLEDVYLQAYELGCKGCTTYRKSEVRGSIFQEIKEEEYV